MKPPPKPRALNTTQWTRLVSWVRAYDPAGIHLDEVMAAVRGDKLTKLKVVPEDAVLTAANCAGFTLNETKVFERTAREAA